MFVFVFMLLLCSMFFFVCVHWMQKQGIQGCVVLYFTTNPYSTPQYYDFYMFALFFVSSCLFVWFIFFLCVSFTVCFVLIIILCVCVPDVSDCREKEALLGLASGDKFVPKV